MLLVDFKSISGPSRIPIWIIGLICIRQVRKDGIGGDATAKSGNHETTPIIPFGASTVSH